MFAKTFISSISRQGHRSMATVAVKTLPNYSRAVEFSAAKSNVSAPSNGQVQISLVASEVTEEDVRSIRGVSFSNKLNSLAGTTGVGKVTQVGSGVSNVSTGDKVFVFGQGTWADHINLSENNVMKISADDVSVATLPSMLSAWAILSNYVPLQKGDIVLLSTLDATSSIGKAVSLLAKDFGATVHTVSPTDANSKEFQASLQSKGHVRLAVSSQTGKVSANLLRCLSTRGALVMFNNARPEIHDTTMGIDVPASSSIFNLASVIGFDFSAWAHRNPQQVSAAYSALSASPSFAASLAAFKPHIFPVSDASKALEEVEKSGTPTVLKF